MSKVPHFYFKRILSLYCLLVPVTAWPIIAQETVWMDDALPAGATAMTTNDAWNWVTSNPAPYSGTSAWKTNTVAGAHQIYFENATGMGTSGDTLFCYVYLDPVNTPQEVMLQWRDGSGSWAHRAYWGATHLLGSYGSAVKAGNLPAAGQWVKLEVPSINVGLDGLTVTGLAFSLYDGAAAFDKAGKRGNSAPPGPYFAGGTIHLIQEAHQDIGWYPSGDQNGSIQTDAQEDVLILDTALNRMNVNPNLTFMWEDMIGYQEYLQYHPSRVNELNTRINQGRLPFGMGYTQPFESSLSSELLMRQIYFGRKWFNRLFPTRDARVIYNFDAPARGMQMPQIVRKSGGKYIASSRLYGCLNAQGIPDNALIQWHSPDGSSTLLWTCIHYCMNVLGNMGTTALNLNDVNSIKGFVDSWQTYYRVRKLPKHLVCLMSLDYRQPVIYDQQISAWNTWAAANSYPRMKYSTYEEAFDSIAAQAGPTTVFDSAGGERPNLWMYENVTNNEPLITLQRQAGVCLQAGEAFSTFRSLEEGNFSGYRAPDITAAWQKATTADHSIQHNRYVLPAYNVMFGSARDTGQNIFQGSAAWIAGRVNTRISGTSLMIFNALSWQRSDPVITAIPSGATQPFTLKDAAGAVILYQLTPDNKLVFIAQNVPSFGYATYYLVSGGTTPAPGPNQGKNWTGAYDNSFYTITPSSGCVQGIYDKGLSKDLFSTTKFKVADLLDLYSPGNGAGEQQAFQYPQTTGSDKASNYSFTWSCIEDGSVRTVFAAQRAMTHYTYSVQLIVYNTIKRIDVEPAIENFDGTHERELRIVFPVNTTLHDMVYDVPFGVEKIGASECNVTEFGWGSRHQPREVSNFMYAAGSGFGVTVSTSVGGVDYMDPVQNPSANDIIQPMLFASRQQCGTGEWWENRGNHYYRFSIYAHAAGFTNGYRLATQSNNPLLPVAGIKTAGANLPESRSYCSVTPSNIIVTAIKKAEDDTGTVVRLFDIEGVNSGSVTLSFPKNLTAACATDLIEEHPVSVPFTAGTVTLAVRHHAIEALKLNFGSQDVAVARPIFAAAPKLRGVAVNVALSLDRPGMVHLRIVDMRGRTVRYEERFVSSGGTHEFSVAAGSLARGVYLLEAADGKRIASKGFVVMR